MSRITQNDLQATVNRINRTLGRNEEPYTKDDAGKYRSNVGTFHLSGAYGGWALHEMVTDGGAVRDVFGGHMPKRELYGKMHAFLDGIAEEREQVGAEQGQ